MFQSRWFSYKEICYDVRSHERQKKKIFLTNVNDDLQIILKKVSEQDYFEAVS